MATRTATPARTRSAAPKAKAKAPARARTTSPATAAGAPDTDRIMVRMPHAMAERVRREAKRNGTSITGYVGEILAAAVGATSKPAAAQRTMKPSAGGRGASKGPNRGRAVKR